MVVSMLGASVLKLMIVLFSGWHSLLVARASGALVTPFQTLPLIALGVSLVTVGLFVAHSVTSSAVGSKGQAAPLYPLFYYAGSSLTGSAGGWFWSHGGRPSVVGLTVVIAAIDLLMSAFAAKVGSCRG